MANFDKIERKLKQLDQSHLLQFFYTFSDEEKKNFLQHLQSLDLDASTKLFQRAKNFLDVAPDTEDMKPIPHSQFESEEGCDSETLEKYRTRGLEAIGAGEVGVLLLAGGQGTRLGVTYPKGMYSVGLPSGKTIFQIQAERIRRVQHLAKKYTGKAGKVTWYIMTSGPTDEMTETFLKSHNSFGLDPENVVLFKQGLLPCFDFDGKIILEAPNLVALAPDGNGGIYRALNVNGILDDMRRRGVKYIHAHSVDNILTKVADPVFIGYFIEKGGDCAAKVVKKAGPTEAVGVVCQINGRFQVVEYSEISEEKAHLRDEEGNLVYSAGNICNHLFTTAFLQRVSDEFDEELKLHVAKKKIPFVDDNGKTITPEKPNGIKIEKFIFDVFPFSDRFVTWEVPRKSEFSAMKNTDSVGKDCPFTARQDLLALHRTYIEKAGGVVSAEVEISPLLSYTGEGLEDRVKGKTFTETTVLLGEEEISINGGRV
ncbi:UDP-N-acetylhexosamine pyrophosphorylase-like protein 1 [Tribolium madens]|uniref:UDP-N-acetylhexosamine pyrophosphorylase-like protein 1 n=1 Tax=Tribolium madens TaxID=41895 RepID=UPI001CF72C6B|nr:UDP-N-acetylhexosamine pyrophosphorylase-like protein 1 [Tribolium madens]